LKEKGNKKKLLSLFLRIALSVLLLIWLFSKVEIKGILEAINKLDPKIWLFAFFMYIATQIISSLRWWILAKALDFPGKFSTYLGYYFVGMFFNLFLPTAVGGDVLKIVFLSKNQGRRLAATYSVLADRLFGLAAMLTIGACAVIYNPFMLPNKFNNLLELSGILTIITLLLFPLLIKLIERFCPQVGEKLSVLIIFWKRPWAVILAFLLSLILQALGMAAVALLGSSMSINVPLPYYFATYPLVAILTLLPISFNGIGVREGGFVYFLGLKSIPTEVSLTLSLLFFSIQVAASLIGGIAYAFGAHNISLIKEDIKK